MRTAQIREHRAKGRSPWFTIRINGRDVHLGTDPKTAYRRASEVMDASNIPRPEPITVAGLCIHRSREHPPHKWALDAWQQHQGEKLLADLTSDDLQDLVTILAAEKNAGTRKFSSNAKCKRKFSSNTIRTYLAKIMLAVRAATKKGWIRQPLAAPKLPALARRARDLTDDQLAEGFNTMRPHTRRIVLFLLSTGCRPAEAARLLWRHVRLDEAVAILNEDEHKTGRKTGRPRTLFLTGAAIELLQAMPKGSPDTHVFLNAKGGPYTSNVLWSVARRRGWPGMYTLRHSFAQKASTQMPVQDLARLLGHRNVATTAFYYDVRDSRAKDVAARVELPALPEL